jgi:hypothetical protein
MANDWARAQVRARNSDTRLEKTRRQLESLNRGMFFDVIDWSEDQTVLRSRNDRQGSGPRSRAPPLPPGGRFCSCRARRSACFASPAPGFEVRPIPIPSAGKIERPTAVHTVFERPAG